MLRSAIGGSLLAALMIPLAFLPQAVAQKGKKKDPGKPGVRWEYKAVDSKGNEVESGTFRARDSKIFKKDRQIGTYNDKTKGIVKIEITEGKLKGKIDLHLTGKKAPTTWKGEWTQPDGDKAKITVTFFTDK